MYKEILYEVASPMATITLNRPDRLNAWTDRMASEVRHAVAQAEEDRDVVAIVITGAGRGFCAGADLKGLKAIGEGERRVGEASELDADPGDAEADDDHVGDVQDRPVEAGQRHRPGERQDSAHLGGKIGGEAHGRARLADFARFGKACGNGLHCPERVARGRCLTSRQVSSDGISRAVVAELVDAQR